MLKLKSLAIALLAALPAVASAQQVPAQDVIPVVYVSYADLDLRTSAGVKTLDRRLARAVESVCTEGYGTVVLTRKVAIRRCLAMQSAQVAGHRDRAVAKATLKDAMASRTQ